MPQESTMPKKDPCWLQKAPLLQLKVGTMDEKVLSYSCQSVLDKWLVKLDSFVPIQDAEASVQLQNMSVLSALMPNARQDVMQMNQGLDARTVHVLGWHFEQYAFTVIQVDDKSALWYIQKSKALLEQASSGESWHFLGKPRSIRQCKNDPDVKMQARSDVLEKCIGFLGAALSHQKIQNTKTHKSLELACTQLTAWVPSWGGRPYVSGLEALWLQEQLESKADQSVALQAAVGTARVKISGLNL